MSCDLERGCSGARASRSDERTEKDGDTSPDPATSKSGNQRARYLRPAMTTTPTSTRLRRILAFALLRSPCFSSISVPRRLDCSRKASRDTLGDQIKASSCYFELSASYCSIASTYVGILTGVVLSRHTYNAIVQGTYRPFSFHEPGH